MRTPGPWKWGLNGLNSSDPTRPVIQVVHDTNGARLEVIKSEPSS